MYLTIFTPTYNRAKCLEVLYKSLLQQNSNLFVWLIVDDGSTDNTKDIIKEWQLQKKISIEYYYQQNSGKMAAHNLAVSKCKTQLFFCVDSDDYLVPNTITQIIEYWNTIKYNQHLCGIVGLRTITNKNVHVPNLEDLKYQSIYLSDLYKKGFNGETSLIFKTDVLRHYLFPIIKGEKFITEDYIYCQLEDKYKMAFFPKETMICTYRKDGYTYNQWKVLMMNPKGSTLYYKEKAKRSKKLKDQIFLYRYYIAFGIFSKYSLFKILYDSENFLFTSILMPLGIYTYLKIKYVRVQNK